MIIELTEIEGSRLPFEFALPAEEFDLSTPGLKLTAPISVTGEVARNAAQTDVSGKITGETEIDCSRCLKPVHQPLDIDFSVSFVEAEHFSDDREHEVAAQDLDTDVLDGDRIDLKDLVREQILLGSSQQVFCGPGCKGICPRCGADRNLVDCNCDDSEIDPRWAALQDLRS